MRFLFSSFLASAFLAALFIAPPFVWAEVKTGSITENTPPLTRLAMAETPDEDTFVLDKNGNAFEMEAKLAKLIKKYKTPEAIDKIIRRDNPDVETRIFENYGPDKVKVYFYDVGRSGILFEEAFIASFSEKDGKIVEYGCNRGNR